MKCPRTLSIGLLVTLVAFSSHAQPAESIVGQDLAHKNFVMIYRPGKYRSNDSLHQEHVTHIRKMFAEGRMIAAGPFQGSLSAMAILSAANAAEADAIVRADPVVRDSVVVPEFHEWGPTFGVESAGDISADGKVVFAIIYRPGPAWVPEKTAVQQPLDDHGEYWAQAHQTGILITGGCFYDSTGGVAVIVAEGEADALELVQTDPAVRDSILQAELHEWPAGRKLLE